MLQSVLSVSGGAVLGALLRWRLGLWLNAVPFGIPLGTLAANLSGGFLIGLALGVFSLVPGIAQEWRLFIITGFLGALTTFSTFSAEVCMMIQEGRFTAAFVSAGVHLFGSLLMTFLGILLAGLVWGKG